MLDKLIKKGIAYSLLVLFLVIVVILYSVSGYMQTMKDSSPVVSNSLSSQTWGTGFLIIGSNATLKNVTFFNSGVVKPTRACIYFEGNKSLIECQTLDIVTLVATFNLNLTRNIKYLAMADNNGVTWNSLYNASYVYFPISPVESLNVTTFTTGIYATWGTPPTGWTNYTGNGWVELVSLGFENNTASNVVIPSLTLNTNLINNTYLSYTNITINYNGTFILSSVSNITNCTLFNNTNLLNISLNVNLSANNQIYLNYNHSEVYLNLSLNCSNALFSNVTGKYLYYLDDIKPYILNSFINNSNYILLETLNTNFDFYDTYIRSYSVLFYNNVNILNENYTALNLSTNYIYNYTSRTLTFLGYNYTIVINVTDFVNNSNIYYYKYNVLTSSTVTNTTTIENLLKKSVEGTNMLWLIIFIIAFFIFGWVAETPILWGISGIGFIIMAVMKIIEAENYFDFGFFFIFFVLGITTILVAVGMQIIKNSEKKEEKENYIKYK